MTNFNGLPTPGANDSSADNTVPQTVVAEPCFDIDGSVARSVEENVPGAKGKIGARTFLTGFAGAAVACVLALGIQGAVLAPAAANDASTPSIASETVSAPITQTVVTAHDDATLSEAVADKCLPSVVAVDVYVDASTLGSMGQYFSYGSGQGQNQSQDQGGESSLEAYAQGSGVVLTEDGYIITNNHVVEGGSAFKVTVAGETYDAELVGTDPSSDVAVLKAKDASGLTPMEIGDSDNLTIGEWVMTLGSPFGLEQSVATGIVSATSRSQIMDAQESMESGGTGEVTIYPNMIQTDAAINPGNSGGALVDSEGKLIGINTLITSYSGNYSGVGFAIPVNYAINLAQQIIAGETPTHAQLGVSLSSISDQMASAYGLSAEEGAYVASVSEGSGAAAAGIVPGDIITAFDGEPVESASDLMLAVRGKNPGDTVTLTVNSGGQSKDVQVTLGDDAASQKAAAEAEQATPENGQRPDNDQGNDYGYGWGNGGDGYGYGQDGYGYGQDGGNDYGYGWGDQYGQDGGNGYGWGDQYGQDGGNGYGQDGRGLNLDDLFGQR